LAAGMLILRGAMSECNEGGEEGGGRKVRRRCGWVQAAVSQSTRVAVSRATPGRVPTARESGS
jgi:hypothetical protein